MLQCEQIEHLLYFYTVRTVMSVLLGVHYLWTLPIIPTRSSVELILKGLIPGRNSSIVS